MDKQRLIAEVRKRPGLWDMQSEKYKSPRVNLLQLWQEVAQCLGENVTTDQCKREWRNLRDAYRGILRRFPADTSVSQHAYNSKWIYFDEMHFIKNAGRHKRDSLLYSNESCEREQLSESDKFEECENKHNIKQETDVEMSAITSSLKNAKCNQSNSEKSGVIFSQQTQTENTFSPIPMVVINRELFTDQRITQDNLAYCSCPKSSADQMDDSEDPEEEDEQNLIKISHLDTLGFSDKLYFDDPDYNFLISFLPQLKKMNELQILQFRAKITKYILTIMSEPLTNDK